MFGRQDKADIRCIFKAQWLMAVIVVVASLVLVSRLAAMSAICGATVSLIPTALFGYMVFRYKGASQSKNILHSFYMGEGIKLLLTALMFSTYLCFFKPILSVFFVSFLLVHISFCLAPLLRMRTLTEIEFSARRKRTS